MKKIGWFWYSIIGLVFAIIVISVIVSQPERESNMEAIDTISNDSEENSSINLPDWMTTEITDVLTDEAYKITDFSGTPILLESFAVWCPICKEQQEEIKKLHIEVGESVISIGLNTDPSENEQVVVDHAISNGYDWIFSISPASVTTSLVEDFGTSVVNAPSVPVILICPDQSIIKKLDSGLKSKETLLLEIENNC